MKRKKKNRLEKHFIYNTIHGFGQQNNFLKARRSHTSMSWLRVLSPNFALKRSPSPSRVSNLIVNCSIPRASTISISHRSLALYQKGGRRRKKNGNGAQKTNSAIKEQNTEQ